MRISDWSSDVCSSDLVRNNIFDVYVCLAFGVLGWVMKRTGFPSAPLVLGVILGPLAERYFMTALANYRQDWTVFFTRPISAIILALAAAFALWALYPSIKSTAAVLGGRRGLQIGSAAWWVRVGQYV